MTGKYDMMLLTLLPYSLTKILFYFLIYIYICDIVLNLQTYHVSFKVVEFFVSNKVQCIASCGIVIQLTFACGI